MSTRPLPDLAARLALDLADRPMTRPEIIAEVGNTRSADRLLAILRRALDESSGVRLVTERDYTGGSGGRATYRIAPR